MVGRAKENYNGWIDTILFRNERMLNVFLHVKLLPDPTKIAQAIPSFQNLAGRLIGLVCIVGNI